MTALLRRLALAPAVIAAFALGGCEKLCGPSGIGVFCPETEANPLNDAPLVDGGIDFEPRHFCNDVNVGDLVRFSLAGAFDPDGDPLLYEWDLNGDGSFEAGGPNPSTIYRTPGFVPVRVRVSDFPKHLGAPGEVERSLRLRVSEPDRNGPPEAAFSATAPAVAGHAVAFDAGQTTDPDAVGESDFAYQWDFGDGTINPRPGVVQGGLRTVTHVYERPGDYTVRLRVHDCLGGIDEAELRLAVSAPSPSDRAPTARFTASPAEPFVGQAVRLDGSGSSDPNGRIVAYDWDVDGNGTFERPGTGPDIETSFATAGEHVVGLRVTDDEGLVNVVHGSVRVRINSPPQAFFDVFPRTPFVGRPARFDARASDDLEGEIMRYEWDLDGNSSFETDTGAEAEHETTYATPGERFVRLRVTDAAGDSDIFGRTVLVVPDSAARAGAARRARAVPFAARIKPVAGRGGKARRRGSRGSLVGVLGRGRMRAWLPAGAPRGVRRLVRFLRAPWRTRLTLSLDRRTGRFSVRGVALARARRSSACLRLRATAGGRRAPSGKIRLLGGRLRGGASFRFRLERDGSATALGRLRVRSGRDRGLPRACRSL
jgi:YD repeat-containing protein